MKGFLFACALGLLASSYAFAANDATRHAASPDAGMRFTVGAKIPDNVVLPAVPAEPYDTSPELRNYRVFRWKDYVVFVDPGSRRIVGVIE